jgi:hypothetical protein
MQLSTKISLTSLLLAFAITSASSAGAATLAQWTFETSNPATAGPFLAEVGSGTATGVHASSATVYSSPVGNGSARSFSSNNWAIGDYYQFQLSTVGFNGISVSFDQTNSATGPRDFQFAYSTNGTTFTNFGAQYSISQITWGSASSSSSSSFSFNLSGVSTLNNLAAVYFRLIDNSTVSANGGVVAAAGTNRVDNFTVTGTAVPEPSAAAGLFSLGLVGGATRLMRNRRKVQA